MVVAAEWGLFDVFLAMLLFTMVALWVFLVVVVLADVMLSTDLSGWAKAGWAVLVIFLPYLGVFVYCIVRGDSMSYRFMSWTQRLRIA
jgi:hypothetical protein